MAKRLGVGDELPADIELPDQDGALFRPADLRGKKDLVLFFYPKDETPGCTAQACAFRDSYEAFTDAGAEVLGISSESEGSHRAFADHHRLPFRLLADVGGRVRKRLGVPSSLGIIPGRVTYVVDKQGVIQHVFNSQMNAVAHIDEALRGLQATA